MPGTGLPRQARAAQPFSRFVVILARDPSRLRGYPCPQMWRRWFRYTLSWANPGCLCRSADWCGRRRQQTGLPRRRGQFGYANPMASMQARLRPHVRIRGRHRQLSLRLRPMVGPDQPAHSNFAQVHGAPGTASAFFDFPGSRALPGSCARCIQRSAGIHRPRARLQARAMSRYCSAAGMPDESAPARPASPQRAGLDVVTSCASGVALAAVGQGGSAVYFAGRADAVAAPPARGAARCSPRTRTHHAR